MNKLLIDSHIFIWLLHNPKKIGKNTIALIKDADAVFLSQASIFELALKYKKGKLTVDIVELLKGAADIGLERLQIKDKHLIYLSENQTPNKDPFDGLLMAQAKYEDLLLLTSDRIILSSKAEYIVDARI